MTNPHIDVALHLDMLARESPLACFAATHLAHRVHNEQLRRIGLFKFEFEAICKCLRVSGFRSDGFLINGARAFVLKEKRKYFLQPKKGDQNGSTSYS